MDQPAPDYAATGTVGDWEDLRRRLTRAVKTTRDCAERATSLSERDRLTGKAQGFAVALDYLRAYQP